MSRPKYRKPRAPSSWYAPAANTALSEFVTDDFLGAGYCMLCHTNLRDQSGTESAGNSAALSRFRYEVQRCWRKWLSRRSRASRLSWAAFNRLLVHYPLPTLRVGYAV